MASGTHEKRVLGLLGRLLGALRGVWERLGLILERLRGVLERLGRVLESLGASGARLQTSGARSDGNYVTCPKLRWWVRSSPVAQGSPIIKTEETLRTKPYTEKLLTESECMRVSVERMSAESECIE